MSIAQLHDEARAREAEVAEERRRWTAVFAETKLQTQLPLNLLVASLGDHGMGTVTPTFLLPPWDNSDGRADSDVMVDWHQEPEARIRWFDEHPFAGRPTGFTVTHAFSRGN